MAQKGSIKQTALEGAGGDLGPLGIRLVRNRQSITIIISPPRNQNPNVVSVIAIKIFIFLQFCFLVHSFCPLSRSNLKEH